MQDYTDAQLFRAMMCFMKEDENIAELLADYVREGDEQQVRDFLGAMIEERGL